MKLRELFETPLPQDWDAGAMSQDRTFKARLDYALERAKRIGAGSSRVAFLIEYQGRDTVLKIAKNRRGLAQNVAEARILNDPYLPEIVIPLIDFDLESDTPVWIHTEYAEPINNKTLAQKLFSPNKDGISEMIRYAMWLSGEPRSFHDNYEQLLNNSNFTEQQKIISRENADKLADLASSYDINLHDLSSARNWGLYNNEPVVIDLGFTNEVAKLYRL